MSIKEYMINTDAEKIYNEKILGNDIWYFENIIGYTEDKASKEYDNFKRLLSSKLDVHFNNICVVGSGKMGYSFKNGDIKNFRVHDSAVQKASDLDIAVICDKKFEMFWDVMMDIKRNNGKIGSTERDYNDACSGLLRKFVRYDLLSDNIPEVKEWNQKVDTVLKDIQLIFRVKHETSIRLYQNWDGLKNYQISSINKAKIKLSSNLEA